MTLRIRNNEVHIPLTGMKAILAGLFTVICSLIGLSWKASAFYQEQLQEKRELNKTILLMANTLKMKTVVDSLQDVQIAKTNRRVDTIMFANLTPHRAEKQRHRFYTERKINGKVYLTEVN